MGQEGLLGRAPEGWTVTQEGSEGGRACYVADDGRVDLRYFVLLPGVMMMDIRLACSVLSAYNPISPRLATLNWCAGGRCEVDFGSRGSLVVGEGALCMSSTTARAFAYPTAFYRGFEYFIDFEGLEQASRDVLGAFGLSEHRLYDALVPRKLGVTLAPEGELLGAIHAVGLELARDEPRCAWLLLATCRLLLLLAATDLGDVRVAGSYLQRSQRDMAQAVHQHIVENVSPVADLRPLATRFGVSEASLRSYFARVYGESPASFAHRYALRKAASLLAGTDLAVGEVAQGCGYANPSKFSAAFRRAYDMNPMEYRRRSRLG